MPPKKVLKLFNLNERIQVQNRCLFIFALLVLLVTILCIYIYLFSNVRVIIIFYHISHRFYFLVSSPTFLRYFLHVIIVALVIHNILLLLLLL